MADGNYGGAREGAGRKPAGWQPKDFPIEGEDGETTSYERERAMHERVKRTEREFNLAVKQGKHLPRAEVQQASATALSVLTQSLRSVPDTLERVCNLTPEQAEMAQQAIDAALLEVSVAFRAMAGE